MHSHCAMFRFLSSPLLMAMGHHPAIGGRLADLDLKLPDPRWKLFIVPAGSLSILARSAVRLSSVLSWLALYYSPVYVVLEHPAQLLFFRSCRKPLHKRCREVPDGMERKRPSLRFKVHLYHLTRIILHACKIVNCSTYTRVKLCECIFLCQTPL